MRMAKPNGWLDADAIRILGSLTRWERVQIVAALVIGAATPEEVRSATGLGSRTVLRGLQRLVAAGLVEETEDGYGVRGTELLDAPRAAARSAPAHCEPPATPEEKVRRAFLKEGLLSSIPAVRSKRLVILDHLSQEFEPGKRYPEREVNRRLRSYHDDPAALRRYLVDEGFLERERGVYWRAGGTFALQ